jgi:predicted Zn-dependent peptidase
MKHTVKEVVLKNGARGLLVHVDDAQVMTFDVNFRAGEYLVDRTIWETPHLMEHVLLGANQRYRKARLFQAEFEKNGAYSNASTSSYHINYEAECADFEWERVLELLLLAIEKPLFLEEEFQAEVGNVKEELMSRSNNHFRHLSLAMKEQYGFQVMTDKERLKKLPNVSLDHVRKHYKKTHTTSNMRFCIAGNMIGREESIIKYFESMDLEEGTGRTALPDEIPTRLQKPLYIENKTVENMYFYFDTFSTKRLSDKQWDALNLLNNMLTETLHSRILGEAREKGLVYYMGSGFGQAKEASSWWFGAQVMPENSKKLFSITVRELQRLQDGIVEKEDLDAAKAYALGRYQRSGQTVGGIASGYSGRYFYEDIVDDYYMLPDRIKAITKKDIVGAAKQLFQENIWGVGVLGSCGDELVNELKEQLSALWPER